MKLLKICLLLLSFAEMSFAQASNASPAKRGKVIVIPQAGVGLSCLLATNTVNDYYQAHGRAPRGEGSIITGRWTAGIYSAYMLTRKIGLMTGVVYDNSAWKFEATDSRDYKVTQQHRIQLPLLFRVQKLVGLRGEYYLNAGVNASFLQRIHDRIYGRISESDPREFSGITGALQINPGIIISPQKQFSAIMGVDIQYQFTNNFSAPRLYGNLFSVAAVVGIQWISGRNTSVVQK